MAILVERPAKCGESVGIDVDSNVPRSSCLYPKPRSIDMNAFAEPPSPSSRWLEYGALLARGIFVAVFAMALFFKLADIRATAGYIASAGFPVPLVLAGMAAAFEALLVLCLATGAWFRPAALAAGAYVVFLAFAFHGPSAWSGNQTEFGFFVDHFTFLAGLLYAAAHGPGRLGVAKRFRS
jgi:putative oxidoreductase